MIHTLREPIKLVVIIHICEYGLFVESQKRHNFNWHNKAKEDFGWEP